MARPEDIHEITQICVKKLFAEHEIDVKCRCLLCTGRGKRMPLKATIEFPELLKNATEQK